LGVGLVVLLPIVLVLPRQAMPRPAMSPAAVSPPPADRTPAAAGAA
jgi:hypothetical protein